MKRRTAIGLIVLGLCFIAAYLHLPASATWDSDITELSATVISTDDSGLIHTGIIPYGPQLVKVRVTTDPWTDQEIDLNNHLLGKADIDTPCAPGDKVILGVKLSDDKIVNAKVLEHNRSTWLLSLGLLFVVLLIGYAGTIGFRALISFIISVFVIWKVLIAGLLDGKDPLLLTSWVIILLSAVIIFSVAGFTKKGFSAFLGTVFGLGFTLVLTLVYGNGLKINGMTLPFAETLLFSGNISLNMREIFYGAVLLGASGATMDIAMDVAASMEEIKAKKPDISMLELLQSGIRIGRHVIGTMSTTLLLAYSGGFITLLMLFMTKDAHFTRAINLKIVASEIMRTLIGSVNLILVAPLTALIASWLFCGAKLPVTLKGLEKSYSKPLDADSFSAFTILQHLSPFANFFKTMR